MSNKIIYVYYPDIRILFYILIYFMYCCFLCQEGGKWGKCGKCSSYLMWMKIVEENQKEILPLSQYSFPSFKYSTGTFINVVVLSCCSTASLLLSFFHTLHCIENKNKPPKCRHSHFSVFLNSNGSGTKDNFLYYFQKYITLKLKPVVLCFKNNGLLVLKSFVF